MEKGDLERFIIKRWLSYWLSFAVLIAIILINYLFLLSNGTYQLFGSELFGRTFNSMLPDPERP